MNRIKSAVIYHNHCIDGIGSACTVAEYLSRYRQLDDCIFYPSNYDDLPDYENLAGRDVYIVDFSFSLELMNKICDIANEVIWIDHHKTTQDYLNQINHSNFYGYWDTNLCGSTLSHKVLFGTDGMHKVLNYVQDCDLWQWKLENSKQINAALKHFYVGKNPKDIWQDFLDPDFDYLVHTGDLLNEVVQNHCDNVVKTKCEMFEFDCNNKLFGKYKIVIANTDSHISSVGDTILKHFSECDFTIIYFKMSNGSWAHSLRSRGDVDVSEIAKYFGGGGHKPAAGFVLSTPINCHFCFDGFNKLL